MKNIKTIAFDADDTLWENQRYFDEAEEKFRTLMQNYLPYDTISHDLLKIEIENMPIYGFGVKAFTLSMIEAALKFSNNKIEPNTIEKIIDLGKEILNKPVELLDGVKNTLDTLYGKYKLIVVTKGDLLDQERKLHISDLGHYFHHIEIMSDKQLDNYESLFHSIECDPLNFMMIGNSLKSDILPVLELGGTAAYIPHHSTWAHEQTDDSTSHPKLIRIEKITEITTYLT